MKVLLLFAFLGISLVSGDTPANCFYEDIVGTWTFTESKRDHDRHVECHDSQLIQPEYVKQITFDYPNVAEDELGNFGTWTMIYNQGFEVRINGRSYFAFSKYEGNFTESISYCGQTENGWSRDLTVRNWSCFRALKNTPVPAKHTSTNFPFPEQKFRNNHSFINKINALQSLWRAAPYQEFEQYSLNEMHQRAGGPAITRPQVSSIASTYDQKVYAAALPAHFDWREIDGVSYVSPVRDQMSCGSCYAFASMGSLEARIRIHTKNKRQDVFSPQDVIECSNLSQGCAGGFEFLIAGRYAQDQGVVEESCNEYQGLDGACTTDQSCKRTYVSDYSYLGGYYGACNEELMMESLVLGGPFTVSFMVYDDFFHYKGGVYKHTSLRNDFNPLEASSHAVLLVGYGVDESTGEKYWTIKNSWGTSFGEDGFFRILRGSDECGIESAAIVATPLP